MQPAQDNLPQQGGGRLPQLRRGEGRAGGGRLMPRFSRTPTATARSRALRRTMTVAERKLWVSLRNSQLGGFSFRRQHAIGKYVLDFYCPEVKLAVELDGGQHLQAQRKEQDRIRTVWLRDQGIHVVRFWNNEVLNNLDGVFQSIAIQASVLAKGDPHPTSPFQGEEKMNR